MNPWLQYLSSWRGCSSSRLAAPPEAPSDPLDLCALQLLLAGAVDAAALRQARLLATGGRPILRLLLLLLLARLRRGHPRVDGAELLGDLEGLEPPLAELPDELRGLGLEERFPAARATVAGQLRPLLEELRAAPSLHAPITGTPDRDPRPLVCVRPGTGAPSLAFARFEAAEELVLERIRDRLAGSCSGIDPARREPILARLDTLPGAALHAAQREAVGRALDERFLVLTGGPGTGKTTVVARILWALFQADPGLHADSIALCAPTGRAQARLSESVRRSLLEIGGDARLEALAGAKARTLHKLLGARPDGSFRHDEHDPLPHAVVVVDECSMIDLPLFSALLAAVRPGARLILVGDPDQLPSVEAGAVLADLVASPRLTRHVARLTKTHRNLGEIAARSRDLLVGTWDPQQPLAVPVDAWRSHPWAGGEVRLLADSLDRLLEAWVEDWTPSRQILCVLHAGPSGREALNARCDALWRVRHGFPPRALFAPGQPVILTRNLPALDLWNGDLGLVVERQGRLFAAFGQSELPIERLDGLESAWAITVHKAQGSEFDHVLFLLPDRDTPLLTRQIAYTALTRARRAAFVWGERRFLEVAARRLDDRPSRIRAL